ncbi:MAG: RNA methyltransferase [Bacteroidales bacterium]|jgi:23S rRNA (guanosine2251-2'-O)-methyltransferase|nr:RNA methyltransferase [Bacteroidales bacterium]MDI9591619.1 RNA methyltransferase [Bacteroidota bacterium]NLH33770.1 RNA methyltransferase [Lentimicrobium sp.]MBP7873770.1 RNA methyltransferase [Bacteroidales bacterium]MCO6468120.1 RNA methyltransferase [Bacteroidales bacterium]
MQKRKISNSELNRLTPEEFRKANKNPIIIVLDNMRSHNNIGSIFRTADAFLIEAIYLCGITACPPHRDIHKTALGATETVEWKYFEKTETAIEELKSAGYIIYAVEQVENATNLDKLNINKETKIALVVGHEINGVSQQIVNQSDLCIEIPQLGTKHSLNVAVSVGIVVWHLLFLLK